MGVGVNSFGGMQGRIQGKNRIGVVVGAGVEEVDHALDVCGVEFIVEGDWVH